MRYSGINHDVMDVCSSARARAHARFIGIITAEREDRREYQSARGIPPGVVKLLSLVACLYARCRH